jgi:hypothetical protein
MFQAMRPMMPDESPFKGYIPLGRWEITKIDVAFAAFLWAMILLMGFWTVRVIWVYNC